MKLTAVLCRQHVGRWFRKHWYIQGKKILHEMPAETILQQHGIKVVPIKELLYPPKPKKRIEIVGRYDSPIPRNKYHPDFKATRCFIYNDNDLLVEALNQAKALTNTVEISKSLPDQLKNLEDNLAISNEIHEEFKQKILYSCCLEATQEKLRRRKDPEKPMWSFPREYGIPEDKKSKFITFNLVNLIEDYWHLKERNNIQDVSFSIALNAFNKLIKFDLSSELSITSKKPLPAVANADETAEIDLPDLYPLDPTISLRYYNFYDTEDVYPVNLNAKWPCVHTSVVHWNTEKVQNLAGTPVKEEQIISRGLLKGFCIAGSQARAKYGNEVDELPEPVVVQIVQTNGHWYHFSVFQLNTLVLDKHSAVKNIFWSHPRIFLYESCGYLQGSPTLVDYNPAVMNKFMAFYRNE